VSADGEEGVVDGEVLFSGGAVDPGVLFGVVDGQQFVVEAVVERAGVEFGDGYLQ
jgi:hypothetical protein